MRHLPSSLAVALTLAACGSGTPSTSSSADPETSQPEVSDVPSNDGTASSGNPRNTRPDDGVGSEVDAGDGEPSVCESLQANARPEAPDVLVVLDRSGSMAGESWDHAIAAVDKLLSTYPTFRFGLAMYPSVGEELACLGGSVDVTPDDGTTQAIHDLLFADSSRAIKDNGYTPTAATLQNARAALAPTPDDLHERFVLLVTDGQPNCNLAGPEKHTSDVDATLSALDTLLTDGTKTFVIGYRTAQLATVMDQMATHGGTTHHYPVEDEPTLLDAFGKIAGNLAPCTFALEHEAKPEYVRVTLDGQDVPLDATGFSLDDGRTIRLGSSSCATMRDGQAHSLAVTVECEPVHVL